MQNEILRHNDLPEKMSGIYYPGTEMCFPSIHRLRRILRKQKQLKYLRTEKTLAILPIARILFLIISFRAAAVPTFNGIRESLKLIGIYKAALFECIKFNTSIEVQYSSQEVSTQHSGTQYYKYKFRILPKP